jgi:hypothetical protein
MQLLLLLASKAGFVGLSDRDVQLGISLNTDYLWQLFVKVGICLSVWAGWAGCCCLAVTYSAPHAFTYVVIVAPCWVRVAGILKICMLVPSIVSFNQVSCLVYPRVCHR